MMPRGNYRDTPDHSSLVTIPAGIVNVRGQPRQYKQIDCICNYIGLTSMKDNTIYQYRVDFDPQIESVILRRQVFREISPQLFSEKVNFDGMCDARSTDMTKELVNEIQLPHPAEDGVSIKVTVKRVGTVTWESAEMLRLYNTNMKRFLQTLGFYQITHNGAHIHPQLAKPIDRDLLMVRGFKTSASIYEHGKLLMNLEPVHKLMQANNVLQLIVKMGQGPRMQETIRAGLVGKLCVTGYNKAVYRIEDVNFALSPSSTFMDSKTKQEITYKTYFHRRYNIVIADDKQPLLLVVPNNRRRMDREAEKNNKDIYLIPELCNLAGLTETQRNDNRLKFTLIQTSQVSPADRVQQMKDFMQKFHSSKEVSESLKKWGYTYSKEPVQLTAKQFPPEPVGIGKDARNDKSTWLKIDQNASFDTAMMTDSSLAVTPAIPRMAILIARPDLRAQGQILNELKKGFRKIGLAPSSVKTIPIQEGDSPHHYVSHLRQVEDSVTVSIVILNRQNKERYDAIKKLCAVERGIVTQVVTARLMTDARKASGAAVKIGIQVAAKVGGEPWYVDLPLKNAMICGYDTYHDTTKRGRSFGAFVATVNSKFSKWFSRADSHERLDELSAQVAGNMQDALKRYKLLNDTYPDRVFLYRDGVSEGQIGHVFNVEMRKIKEELVNLCPSIKFTMIIVNKRVGARFYARVGAENYGNLPPGTVVDDIVTRKERYDFYLVSQATRAGTVTPTYYNIIHDESGLAPHIHQAMAYKLCLMYYNWTGSVRVPAPCQYAHKLALLCGEHLHAAPNTNLDDRLYFL